MRNRAAWALATAALGIGCTAILGDFTVGGSATGPGNDASPDGTSNGDGSPDDGSTDAPAGLHCAFLPTSFRKVADLKAHDAGDQRYDSLSVVSAGDSLTRIIPKTSGSSSDTLTVLSIRSDKPSDNPNVVTAPGARLVQVQHRPAPGNGGSTELLTAINGSANYEVWSLPDTDSNAALQNPNVLTTPDPASSSQGRAAFLPLAPHDYWALIEFQAAAPTFTVGTVRANGAPGALVPSAATGPTAFSTDFINLVRVGNDIYGYNANDVGGTSDLLQWKWPVDPSASAPGASRTGIGAGLIPISALAVANNTAVQVVIGKLGFDSGGMSITSIELSVGNVPNANFGTFRYTDLVKVTELSNPDAFSFGPKAALAANPGRMAFLGKGGLSTSDGLNFILIDAATSTISFSAVGTGTNLLKGNNRIDSLAMDFAPLQFGNSFAYDVAWTEHVTDAGGDYDAIYYQRLQCDP